MFSKLNSSLFTKSCMIIRRSIINSKISSQDYQNKLKKWYCTSSGPPERQEPAPVRLGFVPDEWYSAFYEKTGVSGFGTLVFNLTAFLISKEYYVLEHEYYLGLSIAILCALAVKNIGPLAAEFLDGEIDGYEKSLNDGRNGSKKSYEDAIEHEQKEQWRQDGQLQIIDAKRENVALQLEAAYRERLMEVYYETRQRLNYCVTREEIEKSAAKRFMVDWVIESVRASVSKEIEDQSLSKCFDELKQLGTFYDRQKSGYSTPSISGPQIPKKAEPKDKKKDSKEKDPKKK